MSVVEILAGVILVATIILGGFGLFRPGFTAGASLAVSRQEQDVVAGKVAALNGAAWILGPAVGVLLYGWHESVFFTLAIAICVGMWLHGSRTLQRGLGQKPLGDQQA